MPPATIGLIAGALAAVALGLVFIGGGAGSALFVPLYALVLCPTGALLGWLTGRLLKSRR